MLDKLHNEEQNILNEIVRICDKNKLNYVLVGGTLLGAIRHKGFIPWDDDLDIAMPRKDYKKFIEICKKDLNEKYFLDYIGSNKNYWLPFMKIRNRKTIYEEKWQKYYNGEKGIWVDIFPLDYTNKENSFFLKLQEKLIKKIKGLLYIKNLRSINKKEDKLLKRLSIKLIKKIPNRFLHKLINGIMSFNKKEDSKYFVNFGSQYGIRKQTHLKEKYFPAIEVEFEGQKYKAPNDYNYVLTNIYGNDYMQLPPEEKRVTHNPIRIKFEDGQEVIFEEGEK